jgi:hypothetical protein
LHVAQLNTSRRGGNRRTLENIEGAGFSIADVEHDRLPKAPLIVRPLIVGAAERI